MPIGEKDIVLLADQFERFLKKHPEADLRLFVLDWIDHSDMNPDIVPSIANILRQTAKYELIHAGAGNTETYIVRHVKKKSLNEKHPVLFPIGLAFIAAILTVLGRELFPQSVSPKQYQLDSLQEKRLIRLSDSLNTLQKNLDDSIATLRADTLYLNK